MKLKETDLALETFEKALAMAQALEDSAAEQAIRKTINNIKNEMEPRQTTETTESTEAEPNQDTEPKEVPPKQQAESKESEPKRQTVQKEATPKQQTESKETEPKQTVEKVEPATERVEPTIKGDEPAKIEPKPTNKKDESLKSRTYGSLANPILIHRRPRTSLPVSTPNTKHHRLIQDYRATISCPFHYRTPPPPHLTLTGFI